ncbi:hypothetical protein MA16_Dca023165 [Dendrobium catenatum]|uniref:Uncharacterized protein n=1 Tax=Dendrobium catenatum TaxID=906689 RepID=A0A2I0VUF1_9ASPA|nr:hypothetical protein MA16_Dca023165 [Dendrobium catenatum]
MAGKKVDVLEGEVGQLKADLEERFFNLQNQITSNNERLEGKFTAMEEMLKILLEMKTNPATSEGPCSHRAATKPFIQDLALEFGY